MAFQRLPTTAYDSDGIEVHESKEVFDSAPDYPDIGDEFLSDEECSRGGIPSDPYLKAILEGKSTSEPAFYEKLLKTLDADDPQRGQLERDKERAILFEAEGKAWRSQYEQAVEYPASRIFVALRSGSLTAQGRLLPAIDIDKAIEMLDEGGGRICDIEPSGIPVTFWSLKGITFEQSAANSDVARYCHITCATRDMLALFPGEREAIGAVERVGDTFVLGDLAEKPPTNALRGRPAYPWDGFHVEVAAMVQNGTLPQKKEAAIHHFQQWFKQEHGILPSRAAVGDKLRPYYAKFLQADGQKSSRRFSV